MKKQGLGLLESGGEKFFEGYGEVVQGDAVSEHDIDDVLQKLEAATIGAVESDEELISEVASLAVADAEEESTLDEVDELDLSAGGEEKRGGPPRGLLRAEGRGAAFFPAPEGSLSPAPQRGE